MVQHRFKTGTPFWNSKTVQHRFKMGQIPKWGTTHIMNGKKEPPTLRLKKLIENLSDYKFDIKFLRGKDMFVSDFLSRHPDNEESYNDPIIPVAFLMKEIVLPEHTHKFMEWLHIMLDSREMLAYKTRDYKECQCERVMSIKEPFRVMTRSMAKTAKAEIPAMYPLQGDHKKNQKRVKLE